MELDWSEQSPHIRSLYRPWQPGDGYDEAEIEAAQARLGFRLPATLRNFYRAWGKRRDMMDRCEVMLPLDSLVLRPDALIFCVENQGAWYWAILREELEAVNPSIAFADAVPGQTFRQVESVLAWMPSHSQVSTFLDDLTYEHAFAGGAVHGGSTAPLRPQPHQIAWLEEHWNKATVTSSCYQFRPGYNGRFPILYVRAGQALTWSVMYDVAAGEAAPLDEIGQALQITWSKRW
jgi:hypothetical protein